MSTIFDYLKEVTYDSIYDRPFNELDVLALDRADLSALWIALCPKEIRPGIPVRLSDAAELSRPDHRFHRDRPTPAISR